MKKTQDRVNRPDSAALAGLPSIYYDRWKFPIQTAMDIDQLLLVVSAYLSVWSREQLELLPAEIATPVLRGVDDLATRAVQASRAEIGFSGDSRTYALLREMSLTLLASTSRLRHLQALLAGGAERTMERGRQ